jgi:hypothetical protein
LLFSQARLDSLGTNCFTQDFGYVAALRHTM